jgi:mucin-19
MPKLSDIALGGAVNVSTDKVIAVRNGTTDEEVTLAASASIDTTNASNISSGTLATANGGTGATSLGTGLTNAGGVLNPTQAINAQTGTSYAIQTTDAGTLITFNNSGAVAATLSVATTTGFTSGFSFSAQNTGTGIVTITPTTSTIGSKSALVLYPGEGAQVSSDGANYSVSLSTAGLRGSGTFANKPSAPITGQEYFATDLGTGVLIVYNGTKWKPIGGSAVIAQTGTATSTTNSATDVTLATVNIPAGLLSANGKLRITALIVATGANGVKTNNIKLSASSGSGAGTVIATSGLSTTQLSGATIRDVWNANSLGAQVCVNLGNSGTGLSTNTVTTAAINMANASFINFDGLTANSGDTIAYSAYCVEWMEG